MGLYNFRLSNVEHLATTSEVGQACRHPLSACSYWEIASVLVNISLTQKVRNIVKEFIQFNNFQCLFFSLQVVGYC